MQHIKSFLNFIDIVLGAFWSITFIELLPVVYSGPALVISEVDNFIKFLFSIAGLVYLVVRILHYYKNTKLDRELKAIDLITRQEELSKKDLVFLKKFYEEFLKDR
jgi:hypothetical protein